MCNDAAAHADIATPRTDAAEVGKSRFSDCGFGPSGFVEIDFARELEREVIVLRGVIESHNAECQRLCQSRDCGFKDYRRQCPECPLEGLVL